MTRKIDFDDLIGLFADTSYPHIVTPHLLQHRDPFIAEIFRQDFKRHQPDLYKWIWMDGAEFEIGQTPKEQFFDPVMHHINQEYKIGCSRLRESIEKSFCINWADLGNGYRIHFAGFCPITQSRRYSHVMLIDFLYRKKGSGRKVGLNGTQRLRKFLDWLSLAKDNPYQVVIIHPAGNELLSKYSPHLGACDYEETTHTTKQLMKLYGYWLKAKKTDQRPAGGEQWDEDTYYRLDCYSPKFPAAMRGEWPYPKVLVNG
mgnify:CR=1 FL=1|jgi:hypothetical protein